MVPSKRSRIVYNVTPASAEKHWSGFFFLKGTTKMTGNQNQYGMIKAYYLD